jgi:hypothetical protein
MTISQLMLMTSLYLAAFVGVAYLTRAKMLRIVGALCGGAAFGVVALLAVALGEIQGWWRVPKEGFSPSDCFYGSVLRFRARQSI